MGQRNGRCGCGLLRRDQHAHSPSTSSSPVRLPTRTAPGSTPTTHLQRGHGVAVVHGEGVLGHLAKLQDGALLRGGDREDSVWVARRNGQAGSGVGCKAAGKCLKVVGNYRTSLQHEMHPQPRAAAPLPNTQLPPTPFTSRLCNPHSNTHHVVHRHQLEILDRGLRDPPPKVEAIGAQPLVPARRLVAQHHARRQAVRLVPAMGGRRCEAQRSSLVA